jgi:phage-related minor tail protein
LADFTTGAKTAGQAAADMANQIVRAIEQVIIKLTIVEPLMRAFQSAFSGGLNLSGLGFNPIAGATGSAHGNVFAGGRIIPFARGGVVDSPSIAPMALFGEAGPEAIVPLKRGADGNLGIASSRGGRGVNVIVNVHNAPAGVQSQTSRMDSNGNVAVDVILKKAIDGMVGDSLSSGSGLRVLKRDFGVKPFMGQ